MLDLMINKFFYICWEVFEYPRESKWFSVNNIYRWYVIMPYGFNGGFIGKYVRS